MRFLLTNDDGISSIFLRELVAALRAEGHDLCVAAPRSEQSWIGAAKSRSRAVESRKVDLGFGCPSWEIDGTPSDCVNIALAHLVPQTWKPDGVVSGINIGMNACIAYILASGTVSGALEGAVHGLPALAVSQDLSSEIFLKLKEQGDVPDAELLKTLKTSASIAARLAGPMLSCTPRNRFIVNNLNFPNPCQADTPIKRTVPAHVVIPRLFSAADDDGAHRMVFRYGEDLSPETPLTDRAALASGWISHTVLDYTKLGRLD